MFFFPSLFFLLTCSQLVVFTHIPGCSFTYGFFSQPTRIYVEGGIVRKCSIFEAANSSSDRNSSGQVQVKWKIGGSRGRQEVTCTLQCGTWRYPNTVSVRTQIDTWRKLLDVQRKASQIS